MRKLWARCPPHLAWVLVSMSLPACLVGAPFTALAQGPASDSTTTSEKKCTSPTGACPVTVDLKVIAEQLKTFLKQAEAAEDARVF